MKNDSSVKYYSDCICAIDSYFKNASKHLNKKNLEKDLSVNLELKLFDNLENKKSNSSSLRRNTTNEYQKRSSAFCNRHTKKKIPIYDGKSLASFQENTAICTRLLHEWAWVFSEGPGIIVNQEAISNLNVIAQATRVFEDIIDVEKGAKTSGDHFGKPGSNDRVWNSLEKHCNSNPANFIDYYKILQLILLPCPG